MQLTIITHLIAAVLATAVAWMWQANAYDARISKINEAHERDKREAVERVEKERDDAVKRNNELTAEVAALDARATKEKEDAQAENAALRSAVAAGERRLRIAAICPAPKPPGDSPTASAAPGLDDDATVELTPEAGRTVFDLRGGIIEDQAKVRGLQDYIRRLLPLCQ